MHRNMRTIRRINVLKHILAFQQPATSCLQGNKLVLFRNCSNAATYNSSYTIKIDDVEKTIDLPLRPELVPNGYVHFSECGEVVLSQTRLHHLRWMLQKDMLGQDILLIGPPGGLRRRLVMQYAELTRREVEYILLNRDTTESDLKQRREIMDGNASYHNQCAVRAAVEGRILLIEGVEKTERNVLPVLNNLLENREMHLEDGRFLMPAQKFDALLQRFNHELLVKWGLVRVSENFRVIALGLPVPKYRGSPLDPPLRSRFQVRNINELPFVDVLIEAKSLAGNVEHPEELTKIVSFGYGIESASAMLPDFPIDNLRYAGLLLRNNSKLSAHELLNRFYPYNIFLAKEGISYVTNLMESLNFGAERDDKKVNIETNSIELDDDHVTVKLRFHDDAKPDVHLKLARGESTLSSANNQVFVPNSYQNSILADVLQTIAVTDVCIVGPKGCGKSILVDQLCHHLDGQHVDTMVLYQDMTARDVLQKRSTNLNGDTIWQDSPLVTAALMGHVIVLDGIHRLHHSTISILHRLVHDREIQLYDGRRLLHHDRYDKLRSASEQELDLDARGVFRIHPGFRIIALAEPHQTTSNYTSASGRNNASWITAETLTLFLFHVIRRLDKIEERHVLESLHGPIGDTMEQILRVSNHLRASSDPIQQALSNNLSTRQLLRISRRLNQFEQNCSAAEILRTIFMSNFMPRLPRNVLESTMRQCLNNYEADGIVNNGRSNITNMVEQTDESLRIGRTRIPLYHTEATSKVPDVVFYNVPQHIQLMERMLQDFLLGEHLLLVGNQGVGKNKIADRFLQLMNRPREYIQLHRDTTVQSLTLQAAIRNGRIEYEDSPLVKAVKYGYILVVDEADKAPIHVTCILKTLIENSEMLLSDGRKICPPFKHRSTNKEKANGRLITTHPDFRMIVLANRPGFPFLGNDFFAALGDLFACHSVENPKPESEQFLLQQYGPSVPLETIYQLVSAFSELREMADVGLLHYPYSTREVVAIVRHLDSFPNDPLAEVIGNVLDYDRYAPEILTTVTAVLVKHGIPVGSYANGSDSATDLREKHQLQITMHNHANHKGAKEPKYGKIDPNNDPHVGGNTWAGGTGGRDTAGLGGKGGPFRLDAGHNVYQLSDFEKNSVPEDVKHAVREMNRKAFSEKLREIQMSPYEHKVYEQYAEPIRQQVQQLRIILQALQARTHERQWQKNCISGELDDTKLVEGLTGESAIFKQRVDQEPEPGQPLQKPKRLKLVVDVSGSMYRFNGHDSRLDRELEVIMMVMEAFDGFESKIRYDIVGHSGEAISVPFVSLHNPPKNMKERLDTIKMMHAHSQFCWSGDHTLDATEHAVNELAKEDCDEAIVIVLSDANLARYSITPDKLNMALTGQSPRVQAYVIFIGSLDDEANTITEKIGIGRAFVCMNLAQLPQIMHHIFETSLLK